jgi:hypothetical protein
MDWEFGMTRLSVYAALLAVCLICPALAQDQGDAAATEKPVGWRSQELPGGYWSIIVSISENETHTLGQELMLKLPEDRSQVVFCDSITRGYVNAENFIPAWNIRNFVWIVRDSALEELRSGEPWLNSASGTVSQGYGGDWPEGMTRAAFDRIMDSSVHLEAGELHCFVYSDAGDTVTLNLAQCHSRYKVTMMDAPELPLAGQLLQEIVTEYDYVDYATLSVATQPGGLGYIDPFGNMVILPPRLDSTLMEARK